MAEGATRRLVLFLDGTWNEDQDETKPATNVVRLREALKIGVDRALREQGERPLTKRAEGSVVRGTGGEPDIEYVVYYDRGVGTGALSDHLRGGASGEGLDLNVRQAYRFLSHHYRPGDEIFLFGFSRGSFTARSIAGFLFAAGLLTSQHCTAENENAAWTYYRAAPNDRFCGEWYRLQAFTHPYDRLSIRCLGVFDTVGALGIPLERFRAFNRERYEFHNTELSTIVDYNFHAVAIDEGRRAFEAALWQTPKFKRYASHVEQVWFPGAHADVGGGYSRWDRGEGGLQDLPFAWMLRRAAELTGLHLAPAVEADPRDPEVHPVLGVSRAEALRGTIHRPWRVLDRVRAPATRMINQIQPLDRDWTKPVGRMLHADPIGEKVHVAALALLGRAGVPREGVAEAQPYRPPNLLAALPAVVATYFGVLDPDLRDAWQPLVRLKPDGAPKGPPLYLVDWDAVTIPAGGPGAPSLEPGRRDALNRLLREAGPPAGLGLGGEGAKGA